MVEASSPHPNEDNETMPARDHLIRTDGEDRDDELAEVWVEGCDREIMRLKLERKTGYLQPSRLTQEWRAAVGAAREAALAAAMLRSLITCGELEYAVYLATRKLVGRYTLASLAAAINDKEHDGVMLSSILVTKSTGEVGSYFARHAAVLGFERAAAELRTDVWSRFATSARPRIEPRSSTRCISS